MNPNISIILPTYNGASRGYLKQAIDSVLQQTYNNIQLIIVNDGSSDETEALCKKYLNRHWIDYVFQTNKGLSAARNAGIRFSKGEYLLFLDDDDVYECAMVEKMLKAFRETQDPKIGMLYCAYHFIDESGKVCGQWYIPAEGDIYERLFYDNYAGSPSGTIIHRSVLEKVGLFNEELKSCEDYDMWLRIARHYHVYSVAEPLLRYRIHANNMSRNIYKIETHQRKVLDSALKESPQGIRDKKTFYYHHLYKEFSAKYFEIGDYMNFRRCLKISKSHGEIERKWKLKYYLSFLPCLTRTLFEAKRKYSIN